MMQQHTPQTVCLPVSFHRCAPCLSLTLCVFCLPLSVCLAVSLSVSLSVSFSLSLSISLTMPLSVALSARLPLCHLSCLSVSPPLPSLSLSHSPSLTLTVTQPTNSKTGSECKDQLSFLSHLSSRNCNLSKSQSQ